MRKTESIQFSGVSRIPDDAACGNGQLAIAMDMVNDGAGLRLIETPQSLFTLGSGERLWCVHSSQGSYRHYVTTYGGRWCWWEQGDDGAYTRTDTGIAASDGVTEVQPMGNTLIVSSSAESITYLLWRDGGYVDLGSRPPRIDIRFGLDSELTFWPGYTDSSKTTLADPVKIDMYHYTDQVPLPYYSAKDDKGKGSAFMPPPDSAQFKPSENSGAKASVFDAQTDCDFSLKGKISADTDTSYDVDSFVSELTEKVMGYYNKFIAAVGTDENRFIFPFFVRYAYEMYDGSLIMHSSPVLMVPNSKAPFFAAGNTASTPYLYNSDGSIGTTLTFMNSAEGMSLYVDAAGESYEHIYFQFYGRIYAFVSKLVYTMEYDDETRLRLKDWKDIVRGLNIYVTLPEYQFDGGGKVYGWSVSSQWRTASSDFFTSHCTLGRTAGGISSGEYKLLNSVATCFSNSVPAEVFTPFTDSDGTEYTMPWWCMSIPMKDADSYRKELAGEAVFYKIAEWTFDDLTADSPKYATASGETRELEIEDGTLKTLAGKEQMTDDFGSADGLSASTSYMYNGRLNLAGVTRRLAPLQPLNCLWPLNTAGTAYMEAVARVQDSSGSGSVYVKTSARSSGRLDYGRPHYLFIPNADAKDLWVKRDFSNGIVLYWHLQLDKHDTLNGAYYLKEIDTALGSAANEDWENSTAAEWEEVSAKAELEAGVSTGSEIYTSKASNPFVFEPEGVNQVADGTVMAMCAAIEPLSSDKYGANPLYVFTTAGVYAMTIDVQTGEWGAVIPPVCRDVIADGTAPLPVLGAVYFLTRRGLVALSGRTAKVVSLSLETRPAVPGLYGQIEELCAGREGMESLLTAASDEFFDRISTAGTLAFDYMHSRVYVSGGERSWVLNLKSGLWTQATTGIDCALNSYPECEFVDAGGNVLALTSDSRKQLGLAVSRPVKLAPGAMQRVSEVFADGFFKPFSDIVWTALYGTRDWSRHCLVASSRHNRITRFGGSPYRAHSLVLLVRDTTGEATVTGARMLFEAVGANRMR